jgi:hypothetical protein
MPQGSEARDEARFVFQGTVQTPGAATLAAVSDKTGSAIVLVERIVRAPDPVIDFAGRRITVHASDGRTFHAGEQGIFYTNVWLLGESLAVELLDFEPLQAGASATGAAATAAAAPHEDAVANFKRHELKKRVESADVVVSGRVTAVRSLDDSGAPATAAAAAEASSGPTTTRISEHEPNWQEAIVEVGQVHKGSHAARTAVVRFPASTDIRWYRAPKLAPGQEGLFVLHGGDRPSAVAAGAALAAPATGTPYYTVLDAADVQPMERAPQVAAIAAALPMATAARGSTVAASRSAKSRGKSARKATAKRARRRNAKSKTSGKPASVAKRKSGAKRTVKSARKSRRRSKSR